MGLLGGGFSASGEYGENQTNASSSFNNDLNTAYQRQFDDISAAASKHNMNKYAIMSAAAPSGGAGASSGSAESTSKTKSWKVGGSVNVNIGA